MFRWVELQDLVDSMGTGGEDCGIHRRRKRNQLPIASVKRKLSGSRPGLRLVTSRARLWRQRIASASLIKTDVSLWTGKPFLSQSIPNIADLLI